MDDWRERATTLPLPATRARAARLLDGFAGAEVAVEVLWPGPPIVFVGARFRSPDRPSLEQLTVRADWGPAEALGQLARGPLGPPVRAELGAVDAAVAGIAAHDPLRDGGVVVALVAPFAPPHIRATRVVVQEVCADGGRLAELAALVDAGRLRLRVAETYGLEDAVAAHARLERGGLRGRVVLTP